MNKVFLFSALLLALPTDELQGIPGDLPTVTAGEGVAISAGVVSLSGSYNGTLLVTQQPTNAALIVENGVVDWTNANVNLPLYEVSTNTGQSTSGDASCGVSDVVLSGSCKCSGGVHASYPVGLHGWRCECGSVDVGCDNNNQSVCNIIHLLCLKVGT